jgi:hypothetical protein
MAPRAHPFIFAFFEGAEIEGGPEVRVTTLLNKSENLRASDEAKLDVVRRTNAPIYRA